MNVADSARAFGCHDIVELGGEPTPRRLDYLDLVKMSGNGGLKVDAVAEFQSRPLLYILLGDRIRKSDNHKMLDLQRILAKNSAGSHNPDVARQGRTAVAVAAHARQFSLTNFSEIGSSVASSSVVNRGQFCRIPTTGAAGLAGAFGLHSGTGVSMTSI